MIITKVDARGSVYAGHSLPLYSDQRQLQCTFTKYTIVDLGLISVPNIYSKSWERNGSVVVLDMRRGVVGSSITCITVLCPSARNVNPCLILVRSPGRPIMT